MDFTGRLACARHQAFCATFRLADADPFLLPSAGAAQSSGFDRCLYQDPAVAVPVFPGSREAGFFKNVLPEKRGTHDQMEPLFTLRGATSR